jgi:hypothetical protein
MEKEGMKTKKKKQHKVKKRLCITQTLINETGLTIYFRRLPQ